MGNLHLHAGFECCLARQGEAKITSSMNSMLLTQAWSLLAIFASTILGLVLDPMPVGAWAFCAITMALATKTLTFQAAFSAMTNEIIWLIVVSFFFAKVGTC